MGLIYLLAGVVGDGIVSVIVAMLVACGLPFFWAMVAKLSGGFRWSDNQNPRVFLAKTTGISSYANATQANSFESLPMFLAGVLLAMYCFVPQFIINGLAWFYVLLRIAFGVTYLMKWATLRSIFWTASMACVVMLFVLSIKMVS